MARAESEAALGDYVALARRRRGSLVVGVLVGLLAAVGVYAATPASYRSTTSVIVAPTGLDTNVTNGRTQSVINLDTEAQIVTSSVVATRAATLLKSPLAARDLAKQVSVGVPANTSVLNISFTAGQAVAAQRGARAFAAAYLANRKDLAESRIDAQRSTLQSSIKGLNDQLQSINEELASGPTPLRQNYLVTQRTLVVQQIKTATTRLGALQTGDVVPGSVITAAQLPGSRTGISAPMLLGSGLLLGLLLGLALALLRDRSDHRIRDRRDLERLGLEVLVDPFELPATSQVRTFRQSHDEPLRQSRNALLARMQDHRGSIVVTAASAGNAGATAAASLAVTMARSGVNTALVCANTEHDVVGSAFGVYGGPNLTDVLRGRVAPDHSLRPVRGTDDLRVLPSGSDGSLFSELLQGAHLRPVLRDYEELSDVVVLDVAPTSVSADAQTLVTSTQGLLLVVTAGVSTTDEVAAAVEQMKHVGADLLGVLLVHESPDQATDEPTDRVARDRSASRRTSHRQPAADRFEEDLPTVPQQRRRPRYDDDEAPEPTRPTRRASRRDRREDDRPTRAASYDATPPPLQRTPERLPEPRVERPVAAPVVRQPEPDRVHPAPAVAPVMAPASAAPVSAAPVSAAPAWSRWDHPAPVAAPALAAPVPASYVAPTPAPSTALPYAPNPPVPAPPVPAPPVLAPPVAPAPVASRYTVQFAVPPAARSVAVEPAWEAHEDVPWTQQDALTGPLPLEPLPVLSRSVLPAPVLPAPVLPATPVEPAWTAPASAGPAPVNPTWNPIPAQRSAGWADPLEAPVYASTPEQSDPLTAPVRLAPVPTVLGRDPLTDPLGPNDTDPHSRVWGLG